jgi:hypothetical protein
MKKIFTLFAAIVFAVTFATQAYAGEPVELGVETGESLPKLGDGWILDWNAEATGYVYTIQDGADVTFTGETDYEQIYIQPGATAHVTLKDAHILYQYGIPFVVGDEETGGKVTLTIEGENSVIVGDGLLARPAIAVLGEAEIVIEGTGTLRAYGSGTNGQTATKGDNAGVTGEYGGGAGIGGYGTKESGYHAAGTITINSGTVYAQGGYNAASIGGGYGNGAVPAFKAITINGGSVLAYTIGGGSHAGECGPLIINGGTVICTYSLGLQVPSQGDSKLTKVEINNNAVVFIANCEIHNIVYDSEGERNTYYPEWLDIITVAETASVYTSFDEVITDEATSETHTVDHFIRIEDVTQFDFRNPDRDALNPADLSATIYFGWVGKGSEETDYSSELATLEMKKDFILPAGAVLTLPPTVLFQGNGHTVYSAGTIYGNSDSDMTINGDLYGEFKNTVFAVYNSIAKVGSADAKVYAANNSLVVEGKGVTGVTVYSLSGQALIKKAYTGTPVSLEQLAKGAYVVRVDTANGALVKKILK